MNPLEYRIIDFSDASLHKTSVLVLGMHQAVLVDAGFRLSDGRRLAQEVAASGRRLSTVFISHGDPDCYFGAEVLRDAFPEARFLAPAPVVQRIEETYRDKVAAWARLGDELSTRLVALEALDDDALELEGHRLEVRGASLGLPDHHYLWEHRSRSLLGGVLLYEGVHVWTADTPHAAQREAWIDLLDEMETLDPFMVAAGHRLADGPDDATAIGWTRDYLKAFETELGKSSDAAGAVAGLKRRYPDAGLPLAAELGTKVAKGELPWG
ncbi:MBL fold metallo-hydrolase [Kitasatospora paracochleata]|uniref:Glyoxylase-like metal-dependent hydrolase (Beta-lactamase superfamily II) n=1 Tax=Kitasatospora paracochleata TaxID=58354 RepID=A0ABT1IT16_9ACTN|nr:MBL fold metallo-hydrolase [Kitasatospora paracochleata]MCP2308224.1 glyoxylase-like metal-dependent hydrolase (beta-lactamase superfamily II) [Kitasatospora paracochleata]